TNGKEVSSFLALRGAGSWRDYIGLSKFIRNLHHFSQPTLKRLTENVADTSRTRPLTVILQSAIDHNGGFHHDPQIAKAVGSSLYNTILIEGPDSLATASTTL